jgi:hypothetical protein
MKTLNNIHILLFSLVFLFFFGISKKVNAQPGITVSFQQFYDELSPYGEWVDDPEYGYIWVPNVDPDFQPYATNGRWVMTDYGNTWVSNYDWGWAPFHYGRWNHNRRFGWTWVPGYEWGPAWVNWRSGGGYYGWAPLGPGMSIGISINIPSNYWVFVPQRYILSPRIHSYYAPRRTVINVYNRTTIINNTYVHNNRTYVTGPRRNEIQRITRSSIPVHRITNASRPGSGRVRGRSVEIYRPNVTRSDQARPGRVASTNDIRSNRPSSGRTENRANTPTSRPSNRNESINSRRPNRESISRRSGSEQRNVEPRTNEVRTRESNNTNRSFPNNSERAQRNNKVDRPSAMGSNRSAPERIRSNRPANESRTNAQPRVQRSEQPRPSSSRQPSSRTNERPKRENERPERASRNIRG